MFARIFFSLLKLLKNIDVYGLSNLNFSEKNILKLLTKLDQSIDVSLKPF